MALALPPTYLLSFNIPLDQLHELELQIGKSLTYDIREAKVVLGKVNTKQRAQFEFRARKFLTEDVRGGDNSYVEARIVPEQRPPRKRRKVSVNADGAEVIALDSSSESGDEVDSMKPSGRPGQEFSQSAHGGKSGPVAASSSPTAQERPSSATSMGSQHEIYLGNTIKVLKLAWYTDSLKAGVLLPVEKYLVYEGRPITQPGSIVPTSEAKTTQRESAADILSRAKADAQPTAGRFSSPRNRARSHNQPSPFITRRPNLIHQNTSEHENISELPPIPSYLHTTYSCQRPTPIYPPNEPFICELKKIRTVRLLTGDEIGVRAYSSAIATLAAYPYTLTSTQEILALPGCDQKIASIYQQWKETGHIPEVDMLETDEKMKVLDLFFQIWGVGAVTARDFYSRGWRNLDDVVEHGWNTLSRVQQIGVKFYDELLEKIPRAEVERIGNTILEHANRLKAGFQMVIVGGYRRGKTSSGDVDVLLSHPDEDATWGFVADIVSSLEQEEWITHTLTLAMTNSERGQTAVSWKGDRSRPRSGFDTLDKALVVWQDPNWPSKEEDLRADPNARNPNIHRRVDIIISPWKTAGCAVMGWSGGTTFQRDLRRYTKKIKRMKFDSSGVRSHEDGRWLPLEEGEQGDMLAKERRVFRELGLEWRDPTERCTG